MSLKGIEMRKVHSQWKMSRIGDFKRENLRHKYVLSLLVKTIIQKSHTIFSIPLIQNWTAIRTWSSINIFALLFKNRYFYLIIFNSEELEKSENNLTFERMDVVLTSSLFESFNWSLFSTFQHWFSSISHEFADDQRRRAPRRDITDLKEM